MYFTDFTFQTPWSTLHKLERLMESLDHHPAVFQRRITSGTTAMPLFLNVRSHDQGAVVTAEVPGIDPARISLSTLADTLTIGIKATPSDEPSSSSLNDATVRCSRTVRLPFVIDSEHTQAQCENGILHVSLQGPKKEQAKTINVNVG